MPTGNSYLPAKDTDMDDWLNNFNTVAEVNVNALPVTMPELLNSTDLTGNFTSALNAAATAHVAAKTATMDKDNTRKIAVAAVRALVKKIQADPAVSDTLKTQLGITVTKPRQKALPVFAPAKAVAAIEAGGIVSLTWDANGNAPGVIYVIETSASASSGWSIVNAQSATRFLDAPVSGGASVYYRVRAQRAKVVSDPSNVVVAMPGQVSDAGTEVHLRAVG